MTMKKIILIATLALSVAAAGAAGVAVAAPSVGVPGAAGALTAEAAAGASVALEGSSANAAAARERPSVAAMIIFFKVMSYPPLR